MVALEGRWEEKKKKTTAFKMVDIPKRVVDVFFFFLLFWFSFLVLWFWLYCRVTRVARGVLWVGLGFIIQHGESFALDWTTLQVHVTFLLLMRWEEGYGRAAASGRFLLKIENRQKSATVGLGGVFFVFMRLVGW